MVFEVKNKVALITGAASGIGLAHARQFLKSGVKGVVIADINSKNGEKVTRELQKEYGENKVLFVKTDISDSASFEDAFKKTLEHFKNIDILINNAAIIHDVYWSKEIDVNLKGTINGIIFGMENYLRNHKQGKEAVIVNTSSLSVFNPIPHFPVYISTKYAIFGLTKCWGDPLHFARTNVRVLGICPGLTDTPIRQGLEGRAINSEYISSVEDVIGDITLMQSPDKVAEEAVKIIEKASNGSIWVIENSQPAYEYKMADRTIYQNDVLK